MSFERYAEVPEQDISAEDRGPMFRAFASIKELPCDSHNLMRTMDPIHRKTLLNALACDKPFDNWESDLKYMILGYMVTAENTAPDFALDRKLRVYEKEIPEDSRECADLFAGACSRIGLCGRNKVFYEGRDGEFEDMRYIRRLNNLLAQYVSGHGKEGLAFAAEKGHVSIDEWCKPLEWNARLSYSVLRTWYSLIEGMNGDKEACFRIKNQINDLRVKMDFEEPAWIDSMEKKGCTPVFVRKTLAMYYHMIKALNSVGEAMGSVLHGVPSGKSVKELFAGMEEHMIKVCDLASETGSPAYQFMASLVRAATWETALELKKKGRLVF